MILDVASGYGRHAFHLARLGASVTCLDNNAKALAAIDARVAGDGGGALPRLLSTQLIDLERDVWPYAAESAGGIVCVHYLRPRLLRLVAETLKLRGVLLLETIGGQGRNYLDLPPADAVRQALTGWFTFDSFQERRVGPAHANAVAVKAFGRKHRPFDPSEWVEIKW